LAENRKVWSSQLLYPSFTVVKERRRDKIVSVDCECVCVCVLMNSQKKGNCVGSENCRCTDSLSLSSSRLLKRENHQRTFSLCFFSTSLFCVIFLLHSCFLSSTHHRRNVKGPFPHSISSSICLNSFINNSVDICINNNSFYLLASLLF
jgi:hypothetical protein